jgi:hypothetical protein
MCACATWHREHSGSAQWSSKREKQECPPISPGMPYDMFAPVISACILVLLFRFLLKPLISYTPMGPNSVIVQAGVAYRFSGWPQGHLTLHACLSAAHVLARDMWFTLPGTRCGFQLWALSVQGLRYAMGVMILVSLMAGFRGWCYAQSQLRGFARSGL